MLGQGLSHVGPSGEVGDPLPFEQLQRGAGLEPLLEHHGRPGMDRGDERVRQPADPEERHRGVHATVGTQFPELAEVVGMADHGPLCVHDRLRVRGAPRREDDDGGISRVDISLGGGERTVGGLPRPVDDPGTDRCGPAGHPVAPDVDGSQGRVAGASDRSGGRPLEARDGLFEAFHVVVAQVVVDGEQAGDVRQSEVPPQFTGLGIGAEQDGDGADPGDRQPGHHPVGAVRGQQADPGPLSDARRQEAAGELGRTFSGVGEGQPLLVQDDELPLAPGCGGVPGHGIDRVPVRGERRGPHLRPLVLAQLAPPRRAPPA